MDSVSTKKRIAIIHGPLVFGGAEKALINMLHYFDYSKYDVTLWLKDGSGEMQEQVDPGVHIKYWGPELEKSFGEHIKSLFGQGKPLHALRSVFYRLLSRAFVNDWHKNFKYHIKSLAPFDDEQYDAAISFHSLVRDDTMILSYALKSKTRIGWIHGMCRHDLNNEYFRPFKTEYGRMHKVFCVSNAVKESLLSVYPQFENKVTVMYNLHRFDRIRELADCSIDFDFSGMTFATVGRLAEEKGQELIPFAAKKLLEKGYSFVWYLVGDGDTRNSIEENICRLDIGNHIQLVGNQANPYPFIKNCSVYVQTSIYEGFGLTLWEAMILGKRIVSTDAPVIHELHKEDACILCNTTADDIAEGIIKALDCLPELIKNDNEFTDDYNYKELEKLYKVIEE